MWHQQFNTSLVGLFWSDPSPIIGYACHWLTDLLTNWLPFSNLDWCDPGMWRWQLKTCWSCWWWETVYSVTFRIQFPKVVKSFSRLESNSVTFLQLVKTVKTLSGGATGSIFIGPESDHWECLSVTNLLTDWLTHCRLINLIDVTLACEDDN